MITTHFRGYLVKSNTTRCHIPIGVSLSWTEKDPMAFCMAFEYGDSGSGTSWTAAYDLLAEAMTCNTTTGDGDVRLRRDDGQGWLRVCIKSPGGHADVVFPIPAVEDFLEQSHDEVSAAQQLIPDQVDKALKEILGGR